MRVEGGRVGRGWLGRGRVVVAAVAASLTLAVTVAPGQLSAEVFDTITTTGDGWDVTFHPTNQDYAFFSHHRGQHLGCFYRIDPDGAGPLAQGDGCFTDGDGDPYTLLQASGTGAVGQKSSVHVTSDGLTAYMPLNKEDEYAAPGTYEGMGKFDISDSDPNNWTAEPNITWDGMLFHSNSIIVDDVIYALNSSGFLLFDTATETPSTVSLSAGSTASNGSVYFADGKIWTIARDFHLNCYDPATGALCAHDNWVDGRSPVAATSYDINSGQIHAVAEYRNTDGSFGGFCVADSSGGNSSCLNVAGELDSTMVNPLEARVAAMGAPNWNQASHTGTFEVSRQHQLITHEPFVLSQDYYCWDYTTQAVCSNFITQTDNSGPGRAYTIRQDKWNDNCFWSNSDDKIIGVWDLSNIGVTECDVVYVAASSSP
ncbi:MAG: hypothetical protein EBY57_11600, partial [Actinobacteria bacterium]|nr:hypothetical protein [Actinomycetota bacterium]